MRESDDLDYNEKEQQEKSLQERIEEASIAESKRLTEIYFPNASEKIKEERINEGSESAKPRIEIDETLSEISEKYAVSYDKQLDKERLAEWNPKDKILSINQGEWKNLTIPEQKSILAHEKVHIDQSDVPYTPYQELDAKLEGYKAYNGMVEQYEGNFGSCSNKGLEKEFVVIEEAMNKLENGEVSDILEDTQLGEKVLRDYKTFYEGLSQGEKKEHTCALKDAGYSEAQIKDWLE